MIRPHCDVTLMQLTGYGVRAALNSCHSTNRTFTQVAYHKWALENNFESKLRSDVEKRKEAAEAEKKRQSMLEAHLHELPPKQCKIIYSERVFRQAVIEWLIATDQVRPRPASLVDRRN